MAIEICAFDHAGGIQKRLERVIQKLLGDSGSARHKESSTIAARITLLLRGFFLVFSGVVPYVSTVTDLGTDLYLVIQVMPNKIAYMLLAVMLACDVLSSNTMVYRMFQYQAHLASSTEGGKVATQLSGIDSTCLSIFSIPGLAGKLVRIALFVILVPLVSVTMHTTALVLAAIAMLAVFKGRGMPQWNFCGLDPVKCAIYRSFVVGWLEAPCSIAFTTFAYLVPRKVVVGTYIDSTAFFLSLAMSMFHVLLEMWETKELMIHNGGSLREALREVSDVRAEQPGAATTDDIKTAEGSQAVVTAGAQPVAGPGTVAPHSKTPLVGVDVEAQSRA
jgi:hypothetical protein